MNGVELLIGEVQPSESRKAIQACNDFLRMGTGRVVVDLWRKYKETQENSTPTRSLNTLQKWSSDYSWQSRAEAYDAELERQKNELTQRRRKEALEAGLALDYERVIKLNKLFSMVETELDTSGLYYTDRKISAKGDVVEIEVFNKAMLDSFRGLLDDIAKEVGGRRQGVEHTGKGGGPITFKEIIVELPDE